MICQATVTWPGRSGCITAADGSGGVSPKADETEDFANGGEESEVPGGGNALPEFGSWGAPDTVIRVGAAGPTSPAATLRHR